jgi:hypothetical protein
MTSIQRSLLLGTALIAIALLAVFDVIPAEVAQYAPLAFAPFVVLQRRGEPCCLRAAT